MGSSSEKVTVGYWYKLLLHYGWCKGPIDAFLELRGGDRTAWKGLLTQSGRISVKKPSLWGGEEAEGGLDGDFDVMFGEADQLPNDYLSTQLGADQPTYRGKATGVWRGGKYGAMNPYPKPLSFKLRRILKGWDNDECWYPEKAAVPLAPSSSLAVYFALDVSGSMQTETANGFSRLANMQAAVNAGLQFIADSILADGANVDICVVAWASSYSNVLYRGCDMADIAAIQAWVSALTVAGETNFAAAFGLLGSFLAGAPKDSDHVALFITDGMPGVSEMTPEQVAQNAADIVTGTSAAIYGVNIDLEATNYTKYVDNTAHDGVPVISGDNPDALTNLIQLATYSLVGMNPAHILYDSLTARDMQGEPVGLINDASFRAAADRLHAEGCGLCTTFEDEDIEDFQQRILNVIGGALSQSRIDGLYYLDLIRGDHDIELLPIITADDIIDFSAEPTNVTESVNQIIVEWFDPQTKEVRTTPPIQALGAIQAAGGVVSDTRSYPEIPLEALAIEVGLRDLYATATPLSRFKLTVNRRHWNLRPGKVFRLQHPAEGIGDLVCVVGDIDCGTLRDGKVKLVALQDVFTFPDSVYVAAESGMATPPDNTPVVPSYQRAIEAPYIVLAGSISKAELPLVSEDAGYFMAMAAQPQTGINYGLYTSADDIDYTFSGLEDWCPTALISDEASQLGETFTLVSGFGLDDIAVGSWALWDDEILRVDAIDIVASSITLKRGCADTLPMPHTAMSRIWFCSDWAGTDGKEYVVGDELYIKMATRTGVDILPLDSAIATPMTFSQRHSRPYPPAEVRINGLYWPSTTDSPLIVTWSGRDRLLQADSLVGWYENAITAIDVKFDVQLIRINTSQTLYSSTDLATDTITISSNYEGDVQLSITAKSGGVECLQPFIHDFMLGTPEITVTPELRAGTSNYSAAVVTTFDVQLPTYQPGDYLLIAVTVSSTTFPTAPAGWNAIANLFIQGSGGNVGYLRLIGKIADGAEGASLTLSSATAQYFSAVALSILADTYSEPRGSEGSLYEMSSVYSASDPLHKNLAPYWGDRHTLCLSVFGQKVSNDDPVSSPYSAFSYSPSISSANIPNTLICGEPFDVLPAVPISPAAYDLTSSVSRSTGTINFAIRGKFEAERPECIYLKSQSSGGSTVSSMNFVEITGSVSVNKIGDLQLLIVMMYGASAVTITPPPGFSLVTKYGARIAIYKRIITGVETWPETLSFSAALSVSVRFYNFPVGTYADTADILTAAATGSSDNTISAPELVGGAGWEGRSNYALHLVVRDGIGGTEPNYNVTSYPAATVENRANGFNQGSSGGRVSFAIAGGVATDTVAAGTFTYAGQSPWESMTILVKGQPI